MGDKRQTPLNIVAIQGATQYAYLAVLGQRREGIPPIGPDMQPARPGRNFERRSQGR